MNCRDTWIVYKVKLIALIWGENKEMEYTIERVKVGDEAILAFIQTESWKAGCCWSYNLF